MNPFIHDKVMLGGIGAFSLPFGERSLIRNSRSDVSRLAALVARLVVEGKGSTESAIDAMIVARAAVDLDPESGLAWNCLSAAYNQAPGFEAEQLTASFEAVGLTGDEPTCWHNLSLALMRVFDFGGALDAIQRALSLPSEPNPYFAMQAAFVCGLLGRQLQAIGYLDETLSVLEAGHPLRKKFVAEVEIARAIAWAKFGRWESFFSALEGRHVHATEASLLSELWKCHGLWAPLPHALVYLEWGVGDQIQFARMVPQLERLHAGFRSVTVMCSSELVRIMRTLPGVDRVLPNTGSAACNLDQMRHNYCVIPVIDLMRDNFQAAGFALGSYAGPYLFSRPGSVFEHFVTSGADDASGHFRVSREPGKIAVGFVWQGDPRQTHDFNRRIAFRHFAEFACQHSDRFSFHSLQTKHAGYGAPWENWPDDVPLEDLSAQISDVASAAEIIDACDVFVGQCGGMLHLAGALGKPAVAMLGAAHDWRWDFEPLYGPNMALVFQDRPGDWPSAFAKLAGAIDSVLNRLPAEAIHLERMAQ